MWKMDFKGVNSGIMHFHTQLTHASRQFWALNIKQTKNSLGKTFLNVVSDLWTNGLLCPKNSFEKKVSFQVLKFYVFLLFSTFLSR